MTVNWNELRDAYGAATRIPALLEAAAVAEAPQRNQDEPWFSLWSSLCHQGDVYTASYAAVPDLIDIAYRRADAVRGEALLLAASIELARGGEFAASMPGDLRVVYETAIARGLKVARTPRAHASSLCDRQCVIAAAVFAGRHDEAERLLNDAESP